MVETYCKSVFKGLCDEKVEFGPSNLTNGVSFAFSTVSSRGVDVCTLVIASWGLRSVTVVPSRRGEAKSSAFEVRKGAFRRRGIVLRAVHFCFVQTFSGIHLYNLSQQDPDSSSSISRCMRIIDKQLRYRRLEKRWSAL
jgi:hypothetical protein